MKKIKILLNIKSAHTIWEIKAKQRGGREGRNPANKPFKSMIILKRGESTSQQHSLSHHVLKWSKIKFYHFIDVCWCLFRIKMPKVFVHRTDFCLFLIAWHSKPCKRIHPLHTFCASFHVIYTGHHYPRIYTIHPWTLKIHGFLNKIPLNRLPTLLIGTQRIRICWKYWKMNVKECEHKIPTMAHSHTPAYR